jgi:protein TonB
MRKFIFIISVLLFCFNIKLQAQSNSEDSSKKKVFTIVEQMPTYPGGEEKMYNFICDSLKLLNNCSVVNDKIIVRFVVEANGTISNIQIIKSVGKIFDAALIETIKKMPLWIPGKQNGKSVPVYFTLPFYFSMN